MKKLFITAIIMSLPVICSAGSKGEPAEPFDRGIGKSTSVFIPKGAVGGGISFSYNDYNVGNASNDMGYNMLFSLVQDMSGSMTTFGIAPHVSYFVADNLAIGLRFDYDRSRLNVGSANLTLGESMSFGIKDYNYFKHMYSGAVTCRYYMPIANSKRFAMFAELRAAGAYGQGESYKVEGDEKFGTYQDIMKLSVGLVPGLSVFVMDEVALEVSVGVLGFDYQRVGQTTNQTDFSQMEQSGANCKINLLSLNMGISFYIPTGQKKLKK